MTMAEFGGGHAAPVRQLDTRVATEPLVPKTMPLLVSQRLSQRSRIRINQVSMAPVFGQWDPVAKGTWGIGSLTLQSHGYRGKTH
jgi:hypothetical protein